MIKNKFIKKDCGFTLIEVMTAAALTGIILTALVFVFISGYDSFIFGNERAEIQRSIRLIEDIVNKNMRYAGSIQIDSQKQPAGEASYDEIFELQQGSSGNYELIYNGRSITDEIISDLSVLTLNNSNLEIKFEFINGSEMRINTLLNNIN